MNIALVIRQALLEANVVRQDGTSGALFTLARMVNWANDCQRHMEAAWRKSGKDYNLVTRESDDGSFTFENETFANSSYQLLSTSRTYTLPPDLITLKRIRALTENYREYTFTPLDVNHPVFRDLENDDNTSGGSEVYWDVIGRRTLRLSHRMPATCEIELMYNARLPVLWVHPGRASNAAGVTLDSTAVTTAGGTVATFLTDRLTTPAEIIFASDAGTSHPIVLGQTAGVDFITGTRTGTGQARPIESFDTATTLTLEATWPYATDSSIGYLIASAPQYLEDHYHLMVAYLVQKIKATMGDARAEAASSGNLQKGMRDFDYDISKRADEAEFVEDWLG